MVKVKTEKYNQVFSEFEEKAALGIKWNVRKCIELIESKLVKKEIQSFIREFTELRTTAQVNFIIPQLYSFV